jgi:CubicO group peptidase (beta-lactamase class C family)
MTTAGYGAPGTPKQIDQPWGHKKTWYWYKWISDQSDNPEALGPAGMVHCSIEDWGKFLSLQLTDENPILERQYLNKLIEPDGFYAGGWGVLEPPWAEGVILVHNGSNGIWFANVVVVPAMDRAFIVATNSLDFSVTGDICKNMTNKLIKMSLPGEVLN